MVRAMMAAVVLALSVGSVVRAADGPIPADFRKALDKAETVDLYSLDPSTPVEKGDTEFHGWKVLGKTEVKKEALTRLVTAFKKGVEEADQRVAAGCFHPRHAIRATLDGKTYDFVICFECVAVSLYGEGAGKNAGFHISRSPAEVFNKVLTDAKVPLPKQARDD